jgi:hypothetical protein
MFLNSGDGLVFRGAVGPWYSAASKEYHLSRVAAAALMKLVVDSYIETNGRPPDELFIHGRARFDDEEWRGFRSAVPVATNLVGVRIQSTNEIKLYRPDKSPIIRGTAYLRLRPNGLSLDKRLHPTAPDLSRLRGAQSGLRPG